MKIILILFLLSLSIHLVTLQGQRRSRRLQEKAERARLDKKQKLKSISLQNGDDDPIPETEKLEISKQSQDEPHLNSLDYSGNVNSSVKTNDNEVPVPETEKLEISKQSQDDPHLNSLDYSGNVNSSAKTNDDEVPVPETEKLEITNQTQGDPHLKSLGYTVNVKKSTKTNPKNKYTKKRQKSTKTVRSTVVDPGNVTEPLRIGSWNVQRLGLKKMKNPEVVTILSQIIRRFDILVVLEVVDKSLKTPILLLNAINDGLDDPYNLTVSDRLGDTSYKEQYAFYYKPSRVSIGQTYQYEDLNNTFQVPPFVVEFEGKTKSLGRFAMVPIHTKPDNAVKEVDKLAEVYEAVKSKLNLTDVMILGDFNSGCDYVIGSEWDDIRLYTNKNFTWLISGHADTTTKSTSCPYDRIVVRGSSLMDSVYKNSAGPYYFDEELGLTNQDLVEDISDHYPVEVLIRGEISPTLHANINSGISVGVSVDVSVTSEAVTLMVNSLSPKHVQHFRSNELSSSCHSISSDCSAGTDVVMVHMKVNSTETAIETLNKASTQYPDVVTLSAVRVLTYKLSHNVLNDASLYGKSIPAAEILISLMCQPTVGQCTISVRTPTTIN